jgi:type II secretory pathway component PulC
MPLQEHRDSIKTRSNSAGVLDRYVYHAGFFIMSPGMIRGFAAIFDGSDDGLYAEKERVGDYTLAKVLPDRAVLEKGGETFSLNRSSLPSVPTPHPSRKGVPISPRPSSDEKEEPSRIVERPEPKGKKPTIERHFTVPAEEKQRIIEDAGRIIREAKPEIERGKDGSITGVKIGEVKPGSVAAGMGLQTGDIIRKVNGIPVSSRGQLLKMYDQVVAGKLRVLDVEIERNGRIFTHRYNVPDRAHHPR